MQIAGATALVTGANRGLGRHLAAQLIDRGATVYAGARNPDAVDLPGAIPVRIDITDPDSVAEAAERVRGLTLLVNNAGVATGRRSSAARSRTSGRHGHQLLRTAGGHPGLRAAARGRAGRSGVLNVLSVLSWITPARVRRVLGRQIGGVVAHQRPAVRARPAGHTR